MFDTYKIYRVGDDRYAVKEFFGGWVETSGGETWHIKSYLTKYCLVSSCEEAHKLIKKRTEYLRTMNPRVRLARECYKD
jgi:hypothetical protein